MVNHGRSGGCHTCKQRRVKCDETKPECQSCQRRRIHCGGYGTKPVKIRFKDQTHKFCTDIGPRLSDPDTSVPFYLRHYAVMGRDKQSTRGFFELLVPVYSSQPQNSVLSLAVSAVASEVMALWQGRSFQSAQETYTQALKCLRNTIQDRNEWGKPATVLAVLSLQFYENVAAIYGLRSASRAHHDGAVSLLPFARADNSSAYLRKYIFHSEMSSAIRQNRPLKNIVRSLLESSNDPTAEPDNPSFALDAIGASVAELHASYLQSTTQNSTLSAQPNSRDWIFEAKHIDNQLLTWSQTVPSNWHPQKLTSEAINPSIPTYQSTCEIYPSCQIGTIWNLWRVQRLLLAKIILNSLSSFIPGYFKLPINERITRNEDFTKYKHTLQDLVTSICHSVPFYLGNTTNPLSILDFTDPTILFPSNHSPISGKNPSPWSTAAEDHKSHIIAQGPWHLMSPLSRLLMFFLEDYGPFMATFLEQGQYEWIRGQFLRVAMLLRIPLGDGDGFGLSVKGDGDTRVEDLARRVRRSAVFMSGP